VAELAEQLARENELECRVLDREALAAGGYNAILAVGKGSIHEPRLVELVYSPPGTPAKTVALVGKTMTFDSGGLDLKSREGMAPMKNDLGGGAAVLGVMRALAVLQPNVRVIGVLAAAENMPSGSAMRPNDVVRALNGKTFEIGDTDAEGRMVLADGVTHAARAGADEIISIATLTGHPFGRWGAAALGTDDALRDRFLAAAEAAGERVWPLPLWEEFRTDLESVIADIRTVGADWSGDTIRAAVFISEFTEGTPWLHLDIAFNADTDRERPNTPKGATGVMVRSLLRYLETPA
jgi:leucyl aminopeptidase